ncbi:hypothetical protein E2562_020555 [Oryza meyeriana var. granulata]|uniref:Uncharacterized protein n=1 Tax=Oryza meyeriana var. granulata TaxID=110450 RepID=A0A6G1EB27_9ORYZ|nr:hypothetical protein E2562_020555 [Oryza meyeriana var. granulata]
MSDGKFALAVPVTLPAPAAAATARRRPRRLHHHLLRADFIFSTKAFYIKFLKDTLGYTGEEDVDVKEAELRELCAKLEDQTTMIDGIWNLDVL